MALTVKFIVAATAIGLFLILVALSKTAQRAGVKANLYVASIIAFMIFFIFLVARNCSH